MVDAITVFSPIGRFMRVPKLLVVLGMVATTIAVPLGSQAGHVAIGAGSVRVADDPVTFTTPIEPIDVYDPREDKGTIEGVCFAYGRSAEEVRNGWLLPGAQAASVYVRSVFRWAGRGSLGQCREFLRSSTNRNCDGQIYPTVGPGRDLPLHFYSDCWSNHAQGRASDFKVGDGESGRVRLARGAALVEWLLAADAHGNRHARARRLGVQEILFFNRCWTTEEPDDLEKMQFEELDDCNIGHYDHVHITFTIAGALGLTSGYGPVAPPNCVRCQPNLRPRH